MTDKQQAAPVAPATTQPRQIPVMFETNGDAECAIKLRDGSVIPVRLVITGVALVEGLQDAFGNQAYSVSSATIPGALIPAESIRASREAAKSAN